MATTVTQSWVRDARTPSTQVELRGFPYTSFPTGWFQVSWSADLPVRDPRPLRFFGRDLVVYRGQSGTVRLFDAHCPHLGAHIGVGGQVQGDDIVCPFHGWRFDTEGVNCAIPYADRPNRSRLLFKWDVVERGGLVLAWHDEAGRAPSWWPDPTPEVDDHPDHFPRSAQLHHTRSGLRVIPQFVIENPVDAAHQRFVHGAARVPEIEVCEADGATFKVETRVGVDPAEPGYSWLEKGEGPTSALLRTRNWGVGVTVARFGLEEAIHITATTPVDHEHSDIFTTMIVPKAGTNSRGQPRTAAVERFRAVIDQFDNDLTIMRHQWYVHPAPFPGEESRRFHTLRNWSTQFYPDAEPGRFGKVRGAG